MEGFRHINQRAWHRWGFSTAIREAIPLRAPWQRIGEGTYTLLPLSKIERRLIWNDLTLTHKKTHFHAYTNTHTYTKVSLENISMDIQCKMNA